MKIARVDVAPHTLETLFTKTDRIFRIMDGIPYGAKLLRLNYNTEKGIYTLLFEHDSLPDVPSGATIPTIKTTIEVMANVDQIAKEVAIEKNKIKEDAGSEFGDEEDTEKIEDK